MRSTVLSFVLTYSKDDVTDGNVLANEELRYIEVLSATVGDGL
jgi:hypothetical protein